MLIAPSSRTQKRRMLWLGAVQIATCLDNEMRKSGTRGVGSSRKVIRLRMLGRVVPDWHPCHPARLQLGVHALATSVLSSLANATCPSESNRKRFQPNWLTSTANPLQAGECILLKPSVGIVPTVFSSNITDNATLHQGSGIQGWKVHSHPGLCFINR